MGKRGCAAALREADENYETIRYEPEPVARGILNRPHVWNAQGWLMLEEMDAAFHAAVEDPDARIIVLSGEGANFSSGRDLDSAEQIEQRQATEEGTGRFQRTERYRDPYVDSRLR